MQTFLLSNAIRGISQRDYIQWKTGEEYLIGNIVVSDRNKYIAMTNGSSGRVKPVHTSGQLTDGGVVWLFVESIGSTDIVTESIYLKLEGETSYYKKLSGTMFSLGKKYKPWTEDIKLEVGDVVLSGDSVFVVIVGGTSSLAPILKSQYSFQTADNIVWRYCGDIPKESKRFITSNYIPIKTNKPATTNVQWQAEILSQNGDLTDIATPKGIQVFKTPQGELYGPWVSEQTDNDTVVLGETSGTGYELSVNIKGGGVTIDIVNAGTGIDKSDKIVIVGDGQGATVKPAIDTNGSIVSLNVTGGNNYTWAKAFVVKTDYAIIGISRLDIAPWEVLNNGTADSLIINTKIDTIPGKVDTTFRYNKISLVSSRMTTDRHLTTLDNYNTLFTKEIDPKQRTDNQEESITLEFNFGE